MKQQQIDAAAPAAQQEMAWEQLLTHRGRVVGNVRVQGALPPLENPFASRYLGGFYRQQLKGLFDRGKSQVFRRAVARWQPENDAGRPFEPWIAQGTCRPSYWDGKVLCMVTDWAAFCGEESWQWRRAECWDAARGAFLPLGRLLRPGTGGVRGAKRRLWARQCRDALPDAQAREDFERDFDPLCFYLDESGLHFFAAPAPARAQQPLRLLGCLGWEDPGLSRGWWQREGFPRRRPGKA